jgi:hypothetical protein
MSMRMFKTVLNLALVLTVLGTSAALAESTDGMTGVDSIIEFNAPAEKPSILTTPAIDTLNPRLKSPIDGVEKLSKEDEDNLSRLWRIVLNRNPIIQYGLKQLATPPELRYAHESAMSKTISGLLNGAAMLPLAMGSSMYASGATAIGTNAVDRAMTNSQKIDPNLLPSDTELVELAGLVQELQKTLLASYFDYKTSLNQCLQLQTMQGKLEAAASKQVSPERDFWNRQLYETSRHQLLRSEQTAKRNFLSLERLVGAEGMRGLSFNIMPPPKTPDTPQEAEEPVELAPEAAVTQEAE